MAPGRDVPAAPLQHVQKAAEGRSRHVVDDDVDRALAEGDDDIVVAVDDAVRPDGPHLFGLRTPRDRRHGGATPLCELHDGRTDATRCAGDDHVLSAGHTRAVQHVLGRPVGTRDRAQLRVTERALHCEDLRGRHFHELREGAVEIGGHPDGLHRPEAQRTHAGPYQDATADHAFIVAGHDLHDAPATIRALDEGKRRRRAPASVVLGDRCPFFGLRGVLRTGGDARGVPAEARVDLGGVDAGGEDPQQELARPRPRDGDITVVELVQPAVSRGDDRHHRLRVAGQIKAVAAEDRLHPDHLLLRCHDLAGRVRACSVSPRRGRPRRPSRAVGSTRPASRERPRRRPPCRRRPHPDGAR